MIAVDWSKETTIILIVDVASLSELGLIRIYFDRRNNRKHPVYYDDYPKHESDI